MSKEKIADAMEYIDDDMIEAVDRLRQGGARKSRPWLKWVAGAAVLCLAVTIALPFMRGVFDDKGSISAPFVGHACQLCRPR